MKEDDPLIPWKIESLPQFLLVVDHSEPALSVWVEERSHIGNALYRHGTRHWLAGGQVQQPLNRLIGQMSDQCVEDCLRIPDAPRRAIPWGCRGQRDSQPQTRQTPAVSPAFQ